MASFKVVPLCHFGVRVGLEALIRLPRINPQQQECRTGIGRAMMYSRSRRKKSPVLSQLHGSAFVLWWR